MNEPKMTNYGDWTGYPESELKEKLTKKEFISLMNWMKGQTIGLVNDEEIIYSWDYDIWNKYYRPK